MVGAGRGSCTSLGGLGDVGPGAVVRIEGGKLKVLALAVEASKDVHLRPNEGGGVAREVGNFVTLDGGLGEGFGCCVIVDNFVEALGISLLTSNEDDVRSDYSSSVLEPL